MSNTDVRLFVASALTEGARHPCDRNQANYLLKVLRLGGGDAVLAFDGVNGEWRARIEASSRSACDLVAETQVRPQTQGPDIDYLFAPLKRARLDYMVQKATELGVARLLPVLTRRTVPDRVNLERMRANAIEAAEQCGVLRVPTVAGPRPLEAVLDTWDASRPLIWCDEGAEISNPVAALEQVPRGPLAVLIGPEGGFDPAEREMLKARDGVAAISLGPRVMRADTAAVAALALVNAVLGDWR